MPAKHSDASALAPLLDGSTAGELIPELVRHGLQQLIELEVAAVLGADRHERSAERLGSAFADPLFQAGPTHQIRSRVFLNLSVLVSLSRPRLRKTAVIRQNLIPAARAKTAQGASIQRGWRFIRTV